LLHNQAKKRIQEILGDQITFEGHFDKVFDGLKETRQVSLIKWVKACQEGKSIPVSSDKIEHLLGFVLKFRDTNFRAILTKKKNKYFIALFLDKHKYYENQRRKLGL
jgi:Holliday junction resolvase